MSATNNFSPNSTNNDIIELLKNAAHSENIYDFEIKTTVGSAKGDGYLGFINSAEITGKNCKDEPIVLKVIVKSAKKGDALREQISVEDIFDREIHMYKEVFPAYKKFEEGKRLVPTRLAPKYYVSSMANKSEALVLENLKEQGYKMYERRIPMDEEHVKLVMEQYGKLHALSLALKDQKPEDFNKLTEPLLDDISVKIMKQFNFFLTTKSKCKKALESLDPVAHKDSLKILEQFIDKIEPYLHSLKNVVDEYSVILHGDCWTNNMMFKYDDKENPTQPTAVDLIDFQLVRLGPPVFDITYFFYACASKSIIDNFKDYLKIYHNSLSKHLQRLGSDPEKLYPYEILKNQWKQHAKYGLLVAVVAIHLMLTEKDEVIDFADMAQAGQEFKESSVFAYEIRSVEAYNERVKTILLHFVENKFI